LKMDQVQGSTGKWHTEVLFPLLLAGSGLIWCFPLSLCGSLHCVIVCEVADTLR
jgi:hypothetical protein